MLDLVKVAAYGSDTPLNQVAQVHAPDANLILIPPWDPRILGEIEKGLRSSTKDSIRRMTARLFAFLFRR